MNKIKTKQEFVNKLPRIYYHLRWNGQLNELNSILGIKNRQRWSKTTCILDSKKYTSIKEWRIKSSSAYNYASKNGILKICTSHMTKGIGHGKWSKKTIHNVAKKCTIQSEFAKNYPGAYGAAVRFNILADLSKYFKSFKCVRWNKIEFVKKEALKYKTISEWKANSCASYNVAREKGWLSVCRRHMVCGRSISSKTKKIKRSDGKVYKSVAEARREFSSVPQALKTGKTAGGYHWAYCDEKGNILSQSKSSKKK